MKIPSSSMKAKAVAAAVSVSAALATTAAVALRGFHRRSVAYSGHSTDLPGVGTILAGRRRTLVALEVEPPVVEELAHGGEEDGRGARFPALEGSTVMFLHIFKCAGSTLRRMLVDWATAEGKNGAIVVACDDPKMEDKICLDDHKLLDEPLQEEVMSRKYVLAGHFVWGFQRHVKGPYLMITSLRNPLEVFVSGKQFMHPDKVDSLDRAQSFVSHEMAKSLARENPRIDDGGTGAGTISTERWGEVEGLTSMGAAARNTQDQRGGFIFRLTGYDKTALKRADHLVNATRDAMQNLEQFWFVGIVEQYGGFIEVLKRLLDPNRKQKKLWDHYSRKHLNSSPVQTRDILAAVDPKLVHRFNGSLALQWKVYEKAVSLWDARCREVLPTKIHNTMCTVAPPLSTYR